MKKIVLLFLAPLFIISQNYEYEPKKKITDYDYSPLWTVYDGGEEDPSILYNLFGDYYFGLSYFGNSFKTNVGFSMLEWTFLLPEDWDKEEDDPKGSGDVALKFSTSFDYIIDFDEDTSSEPQWFGAVCRSDDAPVTPLKGHRSDGTTEVWDRNQHEQNGKWLQTMVWNGRDPESFVDDQVRIGKERAENVIETIIQRTSSQ